jgi:hypothetical protein
MMQHLGGFGCCSDKRFLAFTVGEIYGQKNCLHFQGKSQPSWVSGWSYINEPEVSTEQSEPGEKEGGTKTTGPEKGNYSRVRGGVKKFPCADIERRETNNLFHGSGRRKSKRLFRNHGLSKAKHNLSSERTYLHSVRI